MDANAAAGGGIEVLLDSVEIEDSGTGIAAVRLGEGLGNV